MKLDKQLILNDTPNRNGRIYSKELLDQIKDQINNSKKPLIGTLDYGGQYPNLLDTGFMCENAVTDENSLYADIRLLDTKPGKAIKDSLEHTVFRPMGVGEIVDGKVVNYYINYIAAIPKYNDAVIL